MQEQLPFCAHVHLDCCRGTLQALQGVMGDASSVLPLVAVLAQPLLQLRNPALAVLVQREAVAQQVLARAPSQSIACCWVASSRQV